MIRVRPVNTGARVRSVGDRALPPPPARRAQGSQGSAGRACAPAITFSRC